MTTRLFASVLEYVRVPVLIIFAKYRVLKKQYSSKYEYKYQYEYYMPAVQTPAHDLKVKVTDLEFSSNIKSNRRLFTHMECHCP